MDETKPKSKPESKSGSEPKPEKVPQLFWYAARISNGDPLLVKRLTMDAARFYHTRYAGAIVFMQCTEQYMSELRSEFWGRLYFYPDTSRRNPAVIPDKQMENFILVTSMSDELISLGEVTHNFLVGEKVRVTKGPFQGAEGVIKRIKGDRRLIVSIDGITAVATCHIRPDFLEKVES